MAFWSWSKTPASNATADSTINWAEGQAPSSVNDSARSMMARTAEWRDDISGTITTGGSSTAYTVTTNQSFDSLAHMAGAMIAFVPHATNGATVTLAVDGLTAKPLRSAPSVELPAGVLVQGTPYVATYNNSDAVFYLQSFYALPYVVPVGGLMPFVGTTAPSANFVIPYGQAISRTTYATLFSLVGVTFGNGDTTTTFNVPDLRGRAIFGLDVNTPGTYASRITVAGGNFDGTAIGTAGGAQNHTLTSNEMPSHNHTLTDPGHSHTITAGNNTAGSSFVTRADNTGGAAPSTNSATTGITLANTGGGAAHSIMPPAMVLSYILRVI